MRNGESLRSAPHRWENLLTSRLVYVCIQTSPGGGARTEKAGDNDLNEYV